MDNPTSGILRISAFVSFTYFEEGDPANAAVFIFRDNTGKTVTLATALTTAGEMRALLSEAFSQIEDTGKGIEARVKWTPELGPGIGEVKV